MENEQNTIHRSLKFLRTFNNRAVKQGLTENYPFKHFKLETEETKKEFLLIEELNKLEVYYDSLQHGYHKNSLRAFLFCCYSGVRYSDISLLKFKDIQNDVIRARMEKTERFMNVKLLDKAKDLLTERFHIEQKVFKVPCNQVINRHIKKGCKAAGIKDKKITFHCSRYTFATLALNNGIKLETVQALLGHKELKQTLLYAKLFDKTIESEMEMLNEKLNSTMSDK